MDTLITIASYAFGIVFTIIGVKVLLVAAEITDARKRAWRAGTHDYYGNELKPYDKHKVEYRDGDNT